MGNPEKIEIEGLKTIHKLCKFGADHNMEGCTFTEIVERMFDELAKAQAVPEWISVGDELPTPNKTFSDAVIAWDGLCIRRIPLCLFNSASEVTHWMPIPQPPKAQEPAND